MKKLLSALLSAAILLSFSSCSKEEPKEPTPAELAIAIADEGRVEEAYYKLKELAEAGDAEAKQKLEAFSLVYTKHTYTAGRIHDGSFEILYQCTYEFFYDDEGYLLKKEATNNRSKKTVSEYTYDELGYLIKTTKPHKEYTYDNNGNLIKKSVTDANGMTSTSEYVYDESNRLIKQTHTDTRGQSSSSEYIYDGDGNTVYEVNTNKLGAKSFMERIWGIDGQLIKAVVTRSDGSEAITEYGYDDNGNLIKEKSPDGTVTDLLYGDDGKLIRKSVQTKSNITSYSYYYDDQGNLTKETENEENKKFTNIIYEYDKNGNITKKAWTNSPKTAEQYEEYFDDKSGDLGLTKKTWDDGYEKHVYDGSGNLLNNTELSESVDIIIDEYEGHKIYYHPNKPKIPDIEY